MIEVRCIEGRWAPMVICDICNSPIDRRKPGWQHEGLALWVMDDSTESGSPLHVHKGLCDRKADTRDALMGSEELGVHLFHLFYNAGYSVKDVPHLKELSDMLQEIG